VDVAARLPVTEAIIVGDVPNSYVQVEDLDDAQVKDVVGD